MKKKLFLILCGALMAFAVSCEKSDNGTKKCKCTIHEPGIDKNGGEYEIPKNESCSQFNKEWWEDDVLCSIKCTEKK